MGEHQTSGETDRAGAENSRSGRQAGFTLIEALVAVAVMALVLTVVPHSLVIGRGATVRTDAWIESRLVARAVLDSDLGGHNLSPGVFRGRKNGRAWTADIRPDPTIPTQGNDWMALRVAVAVKVYGDQDLRVETIRIGRY